MVVQSYECAYNNMKIGIISDLNLSTVNYGNNLQAFALNHYLKSRYAVDCVHSIALKGKGQWKRTGIFSIGFIKKAYSAVLKRLRPKSDIKNFDKGIVTERLEYFRLFREEYFPNGVVEMACEDLRNADYDLMIAGSDVVWLQLPHQINAIKFFDFSMQKPFKRISYAASFGRDYIPKENIRYVRKYLKKFDAISVREHSSVAMLNSIGISEVSYCLDPTLLLMRNEWEQIEDKPAAVDNDEKYIFVYLLGQDVQQRKDIAAFSQKMGLKIVSIPNTLGKLAEADGALGGTQISACSIENWLWLIHHAQYMITDSFHGVVFSTIFHKKFVVLNRYSQSGYDINNRMLDYLREIDQLDKSITSGELANIKDLEWDYQRINSAIEVRRKSSVEFLDRAIGEIND